MGHLPGEANLHFKKKKKHRQGMNGWTFSKKSLQARKNHHQGALIIREVFEVVVFVVVIFIVQVATFKKMAYYTLLHSNRYFELKLSFVCKSNNMKSLPIGRGQSFLFLYFLLPALVSRFNLCLVTEKSSFLQLHTSEMQQIQPVCEIVSPYLF